MYKLIAWIAGVATISLSGAASAMDFTLVREPGLSRGSEIVHIEAAGGIEPGDASKLLDLVAELPAGVDSRPTVYFNSAGGDLNEGMAIGALVRNLGLSTFVAKDAASLVEYVPSVEDRLCTEREAPCRKILGNEHAKARVVDRQAPLERVNRKHGRLRRKPEDRLDICSRFQVRLYLAEKRMEKVLLEKLVRPRKRALPNGTAPFSLGEPTW